MNQVKFFRGCLPQILLDPFLNTCKSSFLYAFFAVCPDNTFGDSCDQTCKCQNQALCDARNGSCTCKPGFMGVTCETGML